MDPSQQVELNLTCVQGLKGQVKEFQKIIKNGAHNLTLHKFPAKYLVLDKFTRIIKLEIADSADFTGIYHELIGIEDLTLCKLPKLVDISGLKQSKSLKRVHICLSDALENIEALHGIKRVHIIGCTSVKDLSVLGGHENLYICIPDVVLDNVSHFSTEKDLNLIGVKIKCDMSIFEGKEQLCLWCVD
jgi:hypothetical protein